MHHIASKKHETADHTSTSIRTGLGNVKVTLSDRLSRDGSSLSAALICSQDYYPFGMMMPTRTWDAESSYRFGFNGMEKDDEMKGDGNSYTTEYRMLDVRIGRWFSIDPKSFDFPMKTPFMSLANNPIIYIDPLGDTDFYNLKGKKIGSDGIENESNVLVVSIKTQFQIKKEMRKYGHSNLNEEQMQNCFPLPNDETLNKIETTFRKTEEDKIPNEYGFAGGEKEGQQVTSEVEKGEAGDNDHAPNIKVAKAVYKLSRTGASVLWTAHSHPNAIIFTRKGKLITAGEGPSNDDKSSYNSKFMNIVLWTKGDLGTYPSPQDIDAAKNNQGNWIKRSDKTNRIIIFYNDKKSKSFSYEKLERLCQTINKK